MSREKSLDAVLSSLAQGKGGRHSSLYLWLHRHHAEVSSAIKEHGVHWPDFAGTLAQNGLTDRTGKPASAATAKQTWYRVCKEVAKRGAIGSGTRQFPASAPPAPKPGEIAPGVRPVVARPALSPPPRPGSAPSPDLPPLPDDRPRMPPLKIRNPK